MPLSAHPGTPCPAPARAAAHARRIRTALATLAFLGAPAHAQADPGQSAAALPEVELSAGMHLIHAELADSDEARMRGLMFRTALAPNHGMLFVFDSADAHCMWMRNTLLPLSVAFIGDDGTIVNVEEMKPRTDATHCARRPVRYALEMSAGWFGQHGAGAGSTLAGIARRPGR